MSLEGGLGVPQEAVDKGRNLIALPNFGRLEGLPLSHAENDIREAFSGRTNVLVLPYAAADLDKQAANAIKAFKRILPDLGISSLHTVLESEVSSVLGQSDGVYIAGGDTYELGDKAKKLKGILRQKAAEGVVIAGGSAGAILMASTIEVAEDPVVPVKTLENGERVVGVDGLGLLPDHLKPYVHYIDVDELFSEDDKEAMFRFMPNLEVLFDHLHSMPDNIGWHLRSDPSKTVLALRDDSYVVVRGMDMQLRGEKGGVIFKAGKERKAVEPGADLSYLLHPQVA